ncbi:protein Bouncer [Lampris incognitus]|uniref:protein Bouncer n=1 Tax=Lampris incognitus TaxID=2546036 RepID=UPI0024B496CF|nr:protein Bouncer [Lampris incognitus]
MLPLLYLYLLLPSIRCDNLLCYYSPILEREKEAEANFRLILTECPPAERCFKADGRYGNHSALSARGCMAERDCGQAHSLHLKATVYTMNYACCDWHYCNSGPGVTARSFPLVLTLLTLAVIMGYL